MTDKPTERAPLLSDEAISEGVFVEMRGDDVITCDMTAWYVRDFYEAKITSGELMVMSNDPVPSIDDYERQLRRSTGG
jgi:hypothetical protein